MSSDGYFDDEGELDSAELAQLDAIEAAHSNSQPFTSVPGHPNTFAPPALPTSLNATQVSFALPPAPSNPVPKPALPAGPSDASKPVPATIIDVDADDSYDDFLDDIDPAEFERLDKDVENAYKHGNNRPHLKVAAGSGPTRQLTLFGDALPIAPPRPQRSTQQGGQSKPPRSPRNPFGQKSRKTKEWDHTAFAKSGWRLGKTAKGKGKEKSKAVPIDAGADEEEFAEEFEQYPAPSLKYPAAPPPRCKLKPDILAAQTWIFPTNRPKRDYQFNIIRESLFENTLVAVPTGLGKTFIAGVVMLNYYRWFPEGKVVFVAPTKPLVAQQIDACHQTCGIPGVDAVELTGQNPRAARAKAWAEKRVFYMTPQTLINDLTTENCDPTDIVLLVIDEAHKGTGDYAYAQVVRYLMAHNGHFRILALTATPGSNAEAVQTIVDSLHISHIEIRDEKSIDLRAYMQPKEIVTHVVKMSEDVIRIRDLLVKVMDKIASRLHSINILHNYNPTMMHHYSCTSLIPRCHEDGTGKKHPWVYASLRQLASLARAMSYLLECSVALCHQSVQELTAADPAKKTSNSFRSDPLFKDLVKELERQHNSSFAPHPKLDKLESLALDYFAQDLDVKEIAGRPDQDVEGESQASNTKMMVFTNFRASVDEIVKVLNGHGSLIRATAFIGQGTDKNGKKGIAQKEQLEVIQKFKDGVYNVLVSTSIGEEGLDIGEVDMIICYDAQKTPIRMLQRVGRTGRRRAGKVAVLLSENREEANWQKAKNDYESVQTSIIRGESLELFGDVERLLPDNIKPKCLETHMTMEEYVRDTKRSRSQILPKGTKRKRNADVNRNIPEGASTGFISSAKLIPKGTSKKRKIAPKEYDPDDMEDDEDDLEIEAGVRGALAAGDKLKSNDKGKAPAKKPRKKAGTSTSASRRKKTIPAKSPDPIAPTLSQLSRELKDDTDDMEIEKGVQFSSPVRPLARLSSFKFQGSPSFSDAVIHTHSSPPRPITSGNELEQPDAWLLNGDSDVEIVEDVSTCFVKGSKVDRSPPTTPKESHCFRRSPLSHVPREKIRTTQNAMPPPPLPGHSGMSSDASPELSFAIRAPARRKRKLVGPLSPSPIRPSLFLPQTSSPAASPPRPPARQKQWRRRPIDPAQVKILLDIEAEVSGDDVPGGSSDTEGVESESDWRFVQELAATQASPSYDQTMAYQNSLFTQVPGRGSGPQFSSRPVRRGAFGNGRELSRTHVSSSPHRGESPDQYSMDSFVVEDDDDIVLQDYSRSSDL